MLLMNDEREYLGFYSRSYGLAQLERALAKAKQHAATAAILLADSDRFAALNCTFGHDHGDDVLRQLGRLVEGLIGDKGTVSRFGATDYMGDEFLVVLPSASPVEAEDLAAQINEQVSQCKVYYNHSGDFHFVTMTIGIALYPA